MGFLVYAQGTFQAQSTKKAGLHLSKKTVPLDQMITHSKKLVSSLHHFESKELQKAALDLFEKILQYSSEPKKGTEKGAAPPATQLQSFVDFVLKRPALTEEAYCQLFKQMTNNPRLYVLSVLSGVLPVSSSH